MQLNYWTQSEQTAGGVSTHIRFSDAVTNLGVFNSKGDGLQLVTHADWNRKYSCPGMFLLDTMAGEYY